MSFKFASFCDYLESLEEIVCHDPPLLPQDQRSRLYRQHATWFAVHRKAIDALDHTATSALISTFLPARRRDRIYGLQCVSLFKLLGRCFSLSASARQELASFKTPGNGDLGECLQRLLQSRGPPALPAVTLQEIDQVLNGLASTNRFSAPSVRRSLTSFPVDDSSLGDVVLRLHPVEAKWLVRLILKDFAPVSLDDQLILRSLHFLLPDLLAMQDDLEIASTVLRTTFSEYPSHPDPQSMNILRQTAVQSLRPTPGVKVSRPEYCKARSIKHCLQMTAGGRWLVERKYDGEYCQVHIDLTKGDDWLKIYSKSGRDSTEDRAGLRDPIKKCFRIGTDRCKFKRALIVAGEMVVFSDVHSCILGFEKIRKHAGVFVGTEQNSPQQPGEHLMLVLFDLILLDDEAVLSRSVEERKAMLSSIYKKIQGRAVPAESRVMDFSQTNTEHRLLNHFASSIACQHEGLVLKPCGVSYLGLSSGQTEKQHPRRTIAGIKLKKDYISGLGDEADFAVLGASYSAQEANKRPSLPLKYTHFHLGCLLNQDATHQNGIKPLFKYMATIAYDQCMSTEILEMVNFEGSLPAGSLKHMSQPAFDIDAEASFRMDVYFPEPLVFEVLGSSYSKVPEGYFMLRHPRVKKLHRDRSWRDCITFDGIQKAAADALGSPHDSETQENLKWIAKLEESHKRRHARHSSNTTPRSCVDGATPRSACSDNITTPHPGRILRMEPLVVLQNGTARKSLLPSVAAQGENAPLPTPPDSSPSSGREQGTSSKSLPKRKPSDGVDISSKRLCDDLVSGSSTIVQQMGDRRITKAARRPPLADVNPQHPPQVLVRSSPSILQTHYTDWTEGHCKFEQALRPANGGTCIFSQSVIFICGLNSAEHDRIRQKVLDHGATVVRDLSYWKRDVQVYEAGTDTVGESQAYRGLRKMVLVDPRKKQQYHACYAEVEKLELRKVEIFDYRIVDAMCNTDTG